MLFALIGAMDSCSNGSYEQVQDRCLASSSRPTEASTPDTCIMVFNLFLPELLDGVYRLQTSLTMLLYYRILFVATVFMPIRLG
jgi:hypothetical protein